MKQIYLVLGALLALSLFATTKIGECRIPYMGYNYDVYRNTGICYDKMQPGLLSIARQMAKEYINTAEIGNDTVSDVYPRLFHSDMRVCVTDTFQFNWMKDTIIYVNAVTGGADLCEIISSMDSAFAVNAYSELQTLDHNRRFKLRHKREFREAIKNWDKTALDSICVIVSPDDTARINSLTYHSYLGRLIINNGRLVDAQYLRFDYTNTKNLK